MKKDMILCKCRLLRWGMAVCLPFLMGSCLMEHPEMTADGELGVDPTSISLETNILLDLQMPTAASPVLRTGEDAEDTYYCRIVVGAYQNNRLAEQTVVYEDLPTTNRLQTKVRMDLHARDYRLAVWADYVSAVDTFYNVADLTGVIKSDGSYRANTEYKAAFFANADLDLTGYRDQWGQKVEVELKPETAVGRYELVATDLKDFRERIADGEVTGTSFRARLNYNDYLPVGFNALDGITRHAFNYMSYNRSFSVLDDGSEEMTLAFDYVLLNAGETVSIPMTLEIVSGDGSGEKVIASTTFRVNCTCGGNEIVRSNFLTADPNNGVGIDTEWGDHHEGDLDAVTKENE